MFKKLIYLAFSLILILAISGVVQADLAAWEAVISDANPLHWYKFDETSTDCFDSGSGGLNGTYEDVLLSQEGLFGAGTAVGFERSGANRATFTGATDLPGPWTVEYIVKTTKAPAGSDAQCLHDSTTTSIRLAGYTSIGEAGFTLYGVADYRFTPNAGLTLNDLIIPQDVWVHLVWRNNGSGTQFFIDGQLVATTADMIDLPRLTIGGRSASTSDQLQGVLDEAVVFDRALSDDEIFAHATPTFPVKATNPFPEDGAIHASTWVSLSWTAGSTAASHDVYVGEDFDQVNEGTGDTFRGNQDLILDYAIVGFVGYPYPDGLVPGTTYYWRIDEVEADGETKHKGDVWSFLVPPRNAYNPSPPDGAEYVAQDVSLSWTAGYQAALHNVYFGDDFDDVNNAVGSPPLMTTTYNPGPLEKDKTYYWRVDEFDGSVTHKGKVWSLTTIPTIPINDPNLVGWWSLDEGSGSVAVDLSGHDNHGTLVGDPKWVAGPIGQALEFDGIDDFINIGLGAGDYFSTLNGGFTVAAWTNRASTGTHDVIFGAGRNPEGTSAGADNNGWKLSVTNGDVITFTTLGILDYTSTLGVPVGEWIHLAATLNEDGTEAQIYLNGNLVETISGSSPANPATGLYAIGFGGTWSLEFFDGMLDEVRVYNKILTAEEIT